jgi:hypothetical protein
MGLRGRGGEKISPLFLPEKYDFNTYSKIFVK